MSLIYSHHNVTTSFEYVFVGTDFALASPKSASLRSPSSLISRFCGFKSLQEHDDAAVNMSHPCIHVAVSQNTHHGGISKIFEQISR